jgi:hypothetical protein
MQGIAAGRFSRPTLAGKCWIAPRDIAPAADWAAEIIDAISGARTMVLVFSASSNQSPQVRREVERAVHKQVNILPFRIEDVMPSWIRLRSRIRIKGRGPRTTAGAGETAGSLGAAGSGHGLSAAELRHIEAQLAGYIGPLAKHLVKRAALRANDLEALVAGLATELDTESDRRSGFFGPTYWRCYPSGV